MSGPRVLVAGAGLSGATCARVLAEAGIQVEIREARGHVAGNCHTARCSETGVMEHVYGPHIFHTDRPEVQAFVTRFARFRPYQHRVKARVGGQVFSLPVTLHSINQLFGTTLSPAEARAFIATRSRPPPHGGAPENFEEQALAMVGPEIYRAFFAGYTRKQWGCDPALLPAAILQRLPLRFSYDDRYFSHAFQAIPEAGYTALTEAILAHPRISLHLNRPARPGDAREEGFDHLIWTGPLDAFFERAEGPLGYRSLRFEREVLPRCRDAQGCAVMNYPDADIPFTRISEHRHFAPWEDPPGTLLLREYARDCGPGDPPFYPLRLSGEMARLNRYLARAREAAGVSFLGRLGTYRYLDMDVSIAEALQAGAALAEALRSGRPLPAFPGGGGA